MVPLSTRCHWGLLTALAWSPWCHFQPGVTGASLQLSLGAHGATFNLVSLGPPYSSRLEPMASLSTWCHWGLLTALAWSPWCHFQPGVTGASLQLSLGAH